MNDYWGDAVADACQECGLVATKEQIDYIAGAVEGCHENYGLAHPTPDPPTRTHVEHLESQVRNSRYEAGQKDDEIKRLREANDSMRRYIIRLESAIDEMRVNQ